MRLNVRAFSNFPPHFGAGLGKFRCPFHYLLIELTGKAFALRALASIPGHILEAGFRKVLQKTLKKDEKL